MRPVLKASIFALLAGAVVTTSTACGGAESSGPAAAAPGGAPAPGGTPAPAAVDVVGLVDGTSLARFTTASTALGQPATITGLDGDTSLVGIDHRASDGLLYGVGEAGGIYTLTDTGAASKVGTLSVDLDGEQFGVDFNPAADALRIVSNTGQNLRQGMKTPLADTVEDGKLTKPAMAPATGNVPATGVTAAAYTNSDKEMTTATSLFVLDTDSGRVALQAPANDGTLSPTGNLGVDTGAASGFDIHTGADGVNTGYATLQVGSGYELFRIDLLSGTATSIGALDGNVSDIAVALAR